MLNFKQHIDEVAGKVTSRESHSSAVLLVQPGEPLPKHYGSPRKPWYSPQLNTVLLSGAEAHTRRRLMSQSTALYGPTPVFHLPVLAEIAPAELRRKAATLALARKAVKHDWHILHDTTWLCSFFTSCFRRSKLPKTWRRVTVVALPKPNKPAQDHKSYRLIYHCSAFRSRF